jgi:hypothetical protein
MRVPARAVGDLSAREPERSGRPRGTTLAAATFSKEGSMTRLNLSIALFTVAGVSLPEVAAAQAPAPVAETFFQSYEGTWKCETTRAVSPQAPATKAEVTITIKKEAGSPWYRGDYDLKKTKSVVPLQAVFMFRYDAAAKAPVMVRYDTAGSATLQTAPGATPDKQVFVGDALAMGKTLKVRDTMTSKGSKEMEHTFELDQGKGFQLMSTDVCKK